MFLQHKHLRVFAARHLLHPCTMTAYAELQRVLEGLVWLESDACRACNLAAKKLPFIYDRATLRRFATTHARHAGALRRTIKQMSGVEVSRDGTVALMQGRVAFAGQRGSGALLGALQEGERGIAQDLVHACELIDSVEGKEFLATCFLEIVLHQIWIEQRSQHLAVAHNSVQT